jgi:hypothetical protein
MTNVLVFYVRLLPLGVITRLPQPSRQWKPHTSNKRKSLNILVEET